MDSGVKLHRQACKLQPNPQQAQQIDTSLRVAINEQVKEHCEDPSTDLATSGRIHSEMQRTTG
jgi:hypothetical protein